MCALGIFILSTGNLLPLAVHVRALVRLHPLSDITSQSLIFFSPYRFKLQFKNSPWVKLNATAGPFLFFFNSPEDLGDIMHASDT